MVEDVTIVVRRRGNIFQIELCGDADGDQFGRWLMHKLMEQEEMIFKSDARKRKML